jgi:hypothetical protein
VGKGSGGGWGGGSDWGLFRHCHGLYPEAVIIVTDIGMSHCVCDIGTMSQLPYSLYRLYQCMYQKLTFFMAKACSLLVAYVY